MILERAAAVTQLVDHDLGALTASQRKALLTRLWSINGGTPGFHQLPPALLAELDSCDAPSDVMSPLYDPLLRIPLRTHYKGVLNSFVAACIAKVTGAPARVTGPREHRVRCPCCGFHTLSRRGGYDICAACFWEDDGTDDLDVRVPGNRMTLRRARVNYARLGATAARFVALVPPAPAARFATDASGPED